MINIENLSLSLPSEAGVVEILKDIHFTVKKGESVALVGPSGSGKTSLIMLLAGLERPTSGKITILGADITEADEDTLAAFRQNHIGIVFQSFHLIPTMTALENVALPLEISNTPNAFAAAKAALESVGLSHRLTHYPSQLSGGEQQRVAIARAFIAKPDLLLADEPTGNLDQTNGTQIIELLFNLQKHSGTTLILITHDSALAQTCDRRLHMMNGRITA